METLFAAPAGFDFAPPAPFCETESENTRLFVELRNGQFLKPMLNLREFAGTEMVWLPFMYVTSAI